jgi:hypothetical protein
MTDKPFSARSRESDAFSGAAARFFELLKSFAAQPSAAAGRPPDWAALGSLLAAQFEQWLGSSPAAGAAFAAAAGFPGASASWLPGALPLGPAAAQGAEAQSAWELLMRLGELQGQLAAHWGEIAQGSAQRFIARMRAAGGADVTPQGSLALYETWVECAEEAYAATVHKEEFCRLQAQLVNTAMALLLAQRRQAEAVARGWGLPTREEADALQRQIRELQQQLEARTEPPAAKRAPRSRGAAGAKAPRGTAGRSRRRAAPRGRK